MDSYRFFDYFNNDVDWFNKFYRERGYSRDANSDNLTGHEIQEGYNDMIYSLTDFTPFIIDCCFYMGDGLHEKIKRLLHQMDDDEQSEFLNRFSSILNGIGLAEIVREDKVWHQTMKENGITKFVESTQRLLNLPKWVEELQKENESRSTETGSETPLFRWDGSQAQLAELILFLSASDWLKVNPDFKTTTTFLKSLIKQFLVYDESKKKHVPLNLSSFQKFYEGLKLEDINEITKDDIYKINNERLHLSKETAIFKSIKSIREL